MLSMLAVFAQLERDTIIQRSKWGKLEAAKAGRWQGGQVYGYKYIPGTYKLQPKESEAQIVRQVFDLYETYGMRKIADILNGKKVSSPRGRRWSHELVSYILTNPVYLGKIRHLGKDYSAMHEPIITQEQWNKSQATYERRQKFKIRRYGDSLIAGLVFCGECGARMRYKTVKQKYPKKKPPDNTLFCLLQPA
ncbi:MAG: recombinase family protein [Firmicutes bacterium]|nr:recombinase family protein [Bacillota bacterium]